MTSTSNMAISLIDATIDRLTRHAPFDGMERADLQFLAARLKIAYFSSGTVILEPAPDAPDFLYIIKQGAVLTEGVSGDSGSALGLHEGECFPIGALLSSRAVTSVYRASQDTFCYLLTRAAFNELMQRSPIFQSFCTQRIAHMLQNALTSVQADAVLQSSQAPLTRRLAQAVGEAPFTCDESTPIRAALELMYREGAGSILVTRGEAQLAGIFTLRDLLGRVTLAGAPLSAPIASVMTPDPITLPPEAFAFEAALAMTRHGIHRVVIADGGKPIGVVSEKDLFSLQRIGLTEISLALRTAATLPILVSLAGDIRGLARNLLAQGVSAAHLTQILSMLNDLLSQRVIELELQAAGLDVSCFCWIALGSEGRREHTLASDQDNGIIFADPAEGDEDAMRDQLVPVARRINEAFAQCGFPLCRGEVMASNRKWCLSLAEWKAAFQQWILQGDPESLLNATIFFDFRPLHGDARLAEALRAWLNQAAADNDRFLYQMAGNALTNRPPLAIVRDFAVSQDAEHPGTIDLKVNGAGVFVETARIFALAHGVSHTSTADRLRQTALRRNSPTAESEAWVEAFQFVQLMRLRHQQRQLARNAAPDNHVDPDTLNPLDRRILKESLRLAKTLQNRLALDYRL